MSSEALPRSELPPCLQLPALTRAWERVFKKDSQDGELSSGVERFSEDAEARLAALLAELADGSYRPRTLTRIAIPKKGGQRFLDIPPVRDRIVERAILEHLTPRLDPLFGCSAYGYRPGLGVADAVAEVVRLREEGCSHVPFFTNEIRYSL